METITKAATEFLTWWLALFGVTDPAYVTFAMAALAGFSLLVVIGAVLGILGAVFGAVQDR